MSIVLEEQTGTWWITRWLVKPPPEDVEFKVPHGGDRWDHDANPPIRYISRYEDENGIWHEAADPETGTPPSWGF